MTHDDETFKDIVSRDVKGEAPKDEQSLLREPSNVQRWRDALVSMKDNIIAQRMQKNAELEAFRQGCYTKGATGKHLYFEARADHQVWKARSNWVLTNVEDRLRETKKSIRSRQLPQDEFKDSVVGLAHDARRLIPRDLVDWHDRYCDLFQDRAHP